MDKMVSIVTISYNEQERIRKTIDSVISQTLFGKGIEYIIIDGGSRDLTASITFSKFHVIKLPNKAVDEIQRSEQGKEKDIKSSRYVWLMNPRNLFQKEQTKNGSLLGKRLET